MTSLAELPARGQIKALLGIWRYINSTNKSKTAVQKILIIQLLNLIISIKSGEH